MDITKYIPIGKENAITTKELMNITGMTMRKLRQAINDARISGAVILTDLKTGYWLPDLNNSNTVNEIEHYLKINYLHNQNRNKTIKSAVDLYRELQQKNQMKLKEQ